ncbi:MAG: hypothetical protein Q7S06_03950 [Nanoarchaeota archaeon]|nr:hypothetical protein [Nanoarchaeota archaeon]
MTVLTLKEIMKETDKALVGGTLPIVFLDTSSLIDICKSAREEQMRQKGKTDLPLEEVYADHFLMSLAGKYQTLVSPLTYEEIKRHYSVRLNGHTKEIRETICPLIEKFAADYERLRKFIPDNETVDEDRYLAYWISKFLCGENRKRDMDDISNVDREIVENALLFSKHFSKDGRKAGPVAVLSSDEHIRRPVVTLNYDWGCNNLIYLNSKER